MVFIVERKAERKRKRDIRRGNTVGDVYQSGYGKRDYGYAIVRNGTNDVIHKFGVRKRRKTKSTYSSTMSRVSMGQILYENPTLYRELMRRAPYNIQRELFMDRFNYGRKQGAIFLLIALGGMTAPVTGGLSLESGIISVYSFWWNITKTGLSAASQLIVKGGEVNVVGSLSDGFMAPWIGDFTGAAFELNYDIYRNSYSFSSILDAKSANDVVREAVISSIITMKLTSIDGLVGKQSIVTKSLYYTPNYIGSHGAQKKTRKH